MKDGLRVNYYCSQGLRRDLRTTSVATSRPWCEKINKRKDRALWHGGAGRRRKDHYDEGLGI